MKNSKIAKITSNSLENRLFASQLREYTVTYCTRCFISQENLQLHFEIGRDYRITNISGIKIKKDFNKSKQLKNGYTQNI